MPTSTSISAKMTSSVPGAAASALVVGHADFASGLVSAVDQIGGCGDRFIAMSNRGLSLADLETAIALQVARGVRVVFTDLPAGSTTVAARRVQRLHADLVVATGVSLAALLDFALGAGVGTIGAHAAAQQAIDKGRAAMQVVQGPPAASAGATRGA